MNTLSESQTPMKFVSSLCFVIVSLSLPVSVNADCIACTHSVGVNVVLKDERIVRGYLQWNHSALEALVSDDFAGEVRSYHKDIVDTLALKNLDWYSVEEAFPIWLRLMNRTYAQDVTLQKPRDHLRVFGGLEKIHYPSERYVAVEGKVTQLHSAHIQSIEINPELPLHVDTTGIDVLPLSDIQRLRTKPLFSVEQEFGGGSTVYVVYGRAITLSHILDLILFQSRGDLQGILLNGEYVTNSSTFTPKGGVKEHFMNSNQLTAEKNALKAFVLKAREMKRKLSQVRDEHSKHVSALSAELHSLTDNSSDMPRKQELTERIEHYRVAYLEKENEMLRKYATSSGNRETLRQLGVIVFSYAWD